MIVFALVFAVLAALVHLYIWWLESVAWTTPAAQKVFGMTLEEAERTRFLAYNQGFYNLFLAVATLIGVGVYARWNTVGLTLIVTGTVSMLLAALILVTASSAHRSAAVKQGLFPALALLGVLVGVLR